MQDIDRAAAQMSAMHKGVKLKANMAGREEHLRSNSGLQWRSMIASAAITATVLKTAVVNLPAGHTAGHRWPHLPQGDDVFS